MVKHQAWRRYGKGLSHGHKTFRSRRTHEYDQEAIVRVRKKVYLAIIVFILLYIGYLLFISDNFKVTNVEISGNADLPAEEVISLAKEALSGRQFIFIPKSNYFFLSKRAVEDKIVAENILIGISLKKKFPKTLIIELEQKLGQMVWSANERIFIINLDGKIERELPVRELVNVNVPVVYDLSNSVIGEEGKITNHNLISLIAEIYGDFDAYELPAIQLDYFKVDNPAANYVKIVTKQGFEIQVNYLSSFAGQIDKLKKSLLAGKIDLSKINYINLRVENQVIYK